MRKKIIYIYRKRERERERERGRGRERERERDKERESERERESESERVPIFRLFTQTLQWHHMSQYNGVSPVSRTCFTNMNMCVALKTYTYCLPRPSKTICIPSHCVPFALKPASQVHVKEPKVLTQF